MDINLSWSEFKTLVTDKGLLIQYHDYGETKTYNIWATENSCIYLVEIPHTASPAPGSDEEDFVNNFMSAGNQCVLVKTCPQVRVLQPVRDGEGFSTVQNKINYTVPVDKVLYIQLLNLTAAGDGDIPTEWQADGTAFDYATAVATGGSTILIYLPNGSPHGPFVAGTVIRCTRVAGQAGKDWAASFIGYLEDA